MEQRTEPVKDPAVLKAVTHPLRMRLYGLLNTYGPSTASTLAGRVGEAVAKVSYHLHQLARFGFVAEAPELATDGRERWWQSVPGGIRWDDSAFPEGSEGRAISQAVKADTVRRFLTLLDTYQRDQEAWPPAWRDRAFSTNSRIRVTPDELDEFTTELLALFTKWGDRPVDESDDRQFVYLSAHAFPYVP
ncbi:winged helix-turn-helix domain-containing protein [Longispora albida]|uniref:winged helix-turn-helix domain-containing protein n=1 Tax=Longispora albida TaxID=203523 RepID=UPI000365CBC8|nr:helix-turn-helix domain-containing protein [Longispora albida]